jgi:hypothetical protein
MVAVLLLSVALATATIGSAVASSVDTNKANNGGYTVTPATGSTGIISPLRVSSSITQGQTNWHSKDVTGFYTTLHVDLNWGNPSNSLRLTVYTPDGYTLGPYYDNVDGSIDGRISIYIDNPNGIAQGTWYYEVYGYSVTGTQSYTI